MVNTFAAERRKKKNENKGDDRDDSEKSKIQENLYIEQKNQCQECQGKNAKAKYRPLVNDNGSFLCDQCYRQLYPATAMFDTDENMFSKINQKIREKRANNTSNFPEEEECHACLEHGSYRRCCKRYYCRSCYYESGACPGCYTPSHRSGVTRNQQQPSKMAVLATWGISVSIFLLLVGLVFATIFNAYTKPPTVWGHTCYGWFPQCGKPVCIDFRSSHPSSGIPVDYDFCTVNNTANKFTGYACIFDPELYRWSGELMGFDFCIKDGRNKISTFRQGAYIFEDNFDYWTNETDYNQTSVLMKSAKWANMENAQASDICGINSIIRPYELEHGDYTTSRKNASLVFSGVNERYAETKDLDVGFGGSVEFYVKLAAVVENELATECKTAFDGDVTLSFSVDSGSSWETIRIYPVWKYRGDDFQFVRENIPITASTSATRFRWSQVVFDPQRDYWAIDDVRIFSHLDPSYDESDLFSAQSEKRKYKVHNQQCRFGTEQCTNFPNAEQRRGHFQLRTVDIYITICCIILMCRKLFQDLHLWRNGRKIDPKGRDDSDKLSEPLTKKFSFSVDKTWQIAACSLLILPLVMIFMLMAWHTVHYWEFYSTDFVSTLYVCLSISMDFWTVRKLSMDIFHYWPFYVESCVEIDASDEAEILTIGTEQIPLLDIRDITLFSRELYCALYFSVFVSGLPSSSTMIFIKAIRITHQKYLILLHVFGISALFRSLLGPMWFVELFLSMKYVCATSGLERDTLGRAFGLPSVAHTIANSTIVSLLVLGPCLFYRFRRQMNALIAILLIMVTLMLGALSGSLVGLLRGLPVVPRIHLTTWPKEGYVFTNNRQSKYPHYMANLLSGGMNSCSLYVLNLTEMELFRTLLAGNGVSDAVLCKQDLTQFDKS